MAEMKLQLLTIPVVRLGRLMTLELIIVMIMPDDLWAALYVTGVCMSQLLGLLFRYRLYRRSKSLLLGMMGLLARRRRWLVLVNMTLGMLVARWVDVWLIALVLTSLLKTKIVALLLTGSLLMILMLGSVVLTVFMRRVTHLGEVILCAVRMTMLCVMLFGQLAGATDDAAAMVAGVGSDVVFVVLGVRFRVSRSVFVVAVACSTV